jgi:hypothetical protein
MTAKIPNLVVHRDQSGEAAVVFVHGFTGDPELTWGRFPAFVASDPRLSGWDIFSLGYATTLALDVRGLVARRPRTGLRG